MARRFEMTIGEQKHEYLVLKDAKGINTQPSREAIGEDEFAWIENLMPIGNSFVQAVPQIGASIATITASISLMKTATIGTVNYQICFTSAGGGYAVNLGNSATLTIAAGGTFTTPSMDQWKSERIVIADTSNGYFSWNGTLFNSPGTLATVSVSVTGSGFTSTPSVVVTGGGASTTASANATLSGGGIGSVDIVTVGVGYTSAPAITFSGGGGTGATATAYIMPSGQNGQSIAVYSGRVWIGNNRTLTYSATGQWADFSAANAGGSTVITEGSLRLRMFALQALDNFLYVFGDSSIIVIGDLKVTGSTTTYSQTFLSSTTGTTLQNTITAMERAIVFVNKYGVYALLGASVQKISKALDGIFPLIDFTQTVSAGLVQIYNILCYSFSFTYLDPAGTRKIQAVYFDGKWFITAQGAISFVSPASVSGVLSLWGTTGTDVSQLYSNTTSTIATTLVTGLYSLGNPIFDKQIIRAGLEYTAPAQATLTFEADTESSTLSLTSTSGSTLVWTNNSGATMVWNNNSANAITWIATGFLLDSFNMNLIGKYLGAKVTSNSPQIILNGIMMEYVQRGAWNR